MMRKMVPFFFFLLCSFPLFAEEESKEAIYLTIAPGVSVNLGNVAEKAADPNLPVDVVRYDLKFLLIHPEGKIQIKEKAQIYAEEVIILPGGLIETDGHHLTIHTKLFDGVGTSRTPSLAWGGKLFGTIDTSPLSKVQPPKPKGARGSRGASAENRHNGPVGYEKWGGDGTPGATGDPGRNGGNVEIVTEEFFGGRFVADGGTGGKGGDGGDGGPGGSGFYYSGNDLPPDDYDPGKVERVCYAGNGGNGENGGDGGPAGNGGTVRVRTARNYSQKETTFQVSAKAGQPGDGGGVGSAGWPGTPGRLGFRAPHAAFGMVFDQEIYKKMRPLPHAGEAGKKTGKKGAFGQDGGGEVIVE